MEKIRINIKPSDLHLRNEMHFGVQKNTRMQIYKNRKAYDRKVDKRNWRKEY